LGETADLFVIAPATAHTLAKLAHGLADNLLTVTALAARCPILIAPAMDGGMYEHPATQENVATLRERGVQFAGPVEGRMASGLSGLGRMAEPAELLGFIRQTVAKDGTLAGRKVVVSTGPTREPLDPVRFISNRSTGKQGLAVAQAALDAGAEVTVVHGPIFEPIPFGATAVSVQTTEEMGDAVLEAAKEADALFMVAAVADFRPNSKSDQKIKKFQHARNEAFAHQFALAVATIGVEAVANHRLAVAEHVGDHRDQAQRHLAEVDVGVADRAGDGNGLFANLDDLHAVLRWIGPRRAREGIRYTLMKRGFRRLDTAVRS
jgi:phosphopantothenoylcysteine decarboxylase/phosphopantothenate--cysteine ligase